MPLAAKSSWSLITNILFSQRNKTSCHLSLRVTLNHRCQFVELKLKIWMQRWLKISTRVFLLNQYLTDFLIPKRAQLLNHQLDKILVSNETVVLQIVVL